MNDKQNESIEEIRNKYKYSIDYSNFLNRPDFILFGILATIHNSYRKFNFSEKISIIDKQLQNKANKDKFESYNEKINEIKEFVKNIEDDFFNEYTFTSRLLHNAEDNYKYYKDNDIYNKFIKEKLDNLIEIFIKYEKKFICFNDQLIDIINLLKINF